MLKKQENQTNMLQRLNGIRPPQTFNISFQCMFLLVFQGNPLDPMESLGVPRISSRNLESNLVVSNPQKRDPTGPTNPEIMKIGVLKDFNPSNLDLAGAPRSIILTPPIWKYFSHIFATKRPQK